MTGREYFERIRIMIDEKNALRREVDELTAMATAIGGFDYSKPDIQSTPGNVTEERIIKLADATALYADAISRLTDMIIEADHRLCGLSRSEYARVIRLRHLDAVRHRWGWIADEMGYAEQTAKNLSRDALTEFEKKYLGM